MGITEIARVAQQQAQAHADMESLPAPLTRDEVDAWAGSRSSNITTRIADHIFTFEVADDPNAYYAIIQSLIAAAAANPNTDRMTVASWQRDLHDLDDRAHSEGRKHIMIAKYRKLAFEIMSNISRGDTPHIGLSGVSAMITSRVQQEQSVKMPQAPPTASSIFGFLNPFKGRI